MCASCRNVGAIGYRTNPYSRGWIHSVVGSVPTRLKLLALSYYIYYRVARPAQAQTLVRQIQAELKTRYSVVGRLVRKRDDATTWMEIYEGVQDAAAFEHYLALSVQAAHFENVLEPGSARHMECFED